MDSSAVRDEGNSAIMCRYTVMETFWSAYSWLVMWYGAARDTRHTARVSMSCGTEQLL